MARHTRRRLWSSRPRSRPTSHSHDRVGRGADRLHARARRVVSRRRMLAALAACGRGGAPASARALRLFNPCLDPVLPEPLASHDIVARALDGIDPGKVIDAHVHLLGVGGGPNGAWVGDQMTAAGATRSSTPGTASFSTRAVCRYVEGCERRLSRPAPRMSSRGVARLPPDAARLRPGPRHATAAPGRRPPRFTFRTRMPAPSPRATPASLSWAASVHPYRTDAVEALDAAVAGGALAVKWLPNAMGIDPGLAAMRSLLRGARPAPHSRS